MFSGSANVANSNHHHSFIIIMRRNSPRSERCWWKNSRPMPDGDCNLGPMQTPSTRDPNAKREGQRRARRLEARAERQSRIRRAQSKLKSIWRRPPRTPRGARGERPESASEDEAARTRWGRNPGTRFTARHSDKPRTPGRHGQEDDETSGKHPNTFPSSITPSTQAA